MQLDSAMVSFREAVRRDPNDISAWGYSAVVAARLNQHAEALSYWERALKLEPRYLRMMQPAERLLYEKSRLMVGNLAQIGPGSARGTCVTAFGVRFGLHQDLRDDQVADRTTLPPSRV